MEIVVIGSEAEEGEGVVGQKEKKRKATRVVRRIFADCLGRKMGIS